MSNLDAARRLQDEKLAREVNRLADHAVELIEEAERVLGRIKDQGIRDKAKKELDDKIQSGDWVTHHD